MEAGFIVKTILLDVFDSWMYWTDASGSLPKIERAWMNGEHREELVSTRLGRPTGLAIDDHMNDRVFWCDSKENLIESMNADGSDRVIVIGKGMPYVHILICII